MLFISTFYYFLSVCVFEYRFETSIKKDMWYLIGAVFFSLSRYLRTTILLL